jgi:hypothetical protein
MKSNSMGKKESIYAEGEKPLTFRQAILLAANTPHKTHKQIDEERKKQKETLKNNKNLKK